LSAPPLKPSISGGPIMGTPAQLVEDLKEIGFDLANAKFTKPELLKDATVEALAIGHSYNFQNGYLTLNKRDSELSSVDLESPSSTTSIASMLSTAGNKTRLPLDSIGELLGRDEGAVLARYGRTYANYRDSSSYGYLKYSILTGERNAKLWKVYFRLDSAMNISQVSIWLAEHKLFRVHLVKDKGVYVASGDGAVLYNDLMECGLSLGIPCTNTQRLRGAKTSTLTPDITAYEYANATIIADTKTLSITSFGIQDNGAFAIENVKRSLLGIAHGEGTFNGGRLIDNFHRGPLAVQQVYGNEDFIPSDDPSDTDVSYNIILDDGASPRHIRLTISFNEAMSPGLFGDVDTRTPLFIMPSAS
jgi:hypothetical protein